MRRTHVHASDPRCKPYPELVGDGGPWRILDSRSRPWLPSPGVTDMARRRVYVPLAGDGHPISLHELAHVRWSPPALPRVRFDPLVLAVLEDARINLGLRALGLVPQHDREALARVRLLAAEDLKRGQTAAFLLRSLASLGTRASEELAREREGLAEGVRGWVQAWVTRVETRLDRARRRARAPVAPFGSAVALARELARELERYGQIGPGGIRVAGIGACVAACDEAGDAPEARARPGRRQPPGEGEVSPGPLEIVEAPLVLARADPARPLGRRWRPAREGSRPWRLSRWPLDGAVFRRPARTRGGTVLVDTSGSMRLRPGDLEAIVDASLGAARVAVYSGRPERGELRIVARGGRRAAAESLEPFGRGNVVDLPALEWLARQPRPRIWISDGQVTGIHDQTSDALDARCAEAAARGGILRLATAADAIACLAGGPAALRRRRTRGGTTSGRRRPGEVGEDASG